MNQVTTWLAGVDWLEVIRSLATLATTAIAFAALKNWQRQDRAKRQAEFLDALVEAVHDYIGQVSRPISLVYTTRVSMKCQTSSWDDEDEAGAVTKGAILFIEKEGEPAAQRLFTELTLVRPATAKLRALSTKGQVFGFKHYARCQEAVAMLTWQFDRIEAFAAMVGSTTLNWGHPDAQRALENVLTVTEDDLRQHVAKGNVAVLEFARETYARIYGVKAKWYHLW